MRSPNFSFVRLSYQRQRRVHTPHKLAMGPHIHTGGRVSHAGGRRSLPPEPTSTPAPAATACFVTIPLSTCTHLPDVHPAAPSTSTYVHLSSRSPSALHFVYRAQEGVAAQMAYLGSCLLEDGRLCAPCGGRCWHHRRWPRFTDGLTGTYVSKYLSR